MSKPAQAVWLVAGLGYGDEGKGTIVDYLVRRESARTVVRYNGGAQAAHRVVLRDGREHVFAQFGSGTFVAGVRTHLSRFMLVEPLGLLQENKHLESLGCNDALERLTIDESAPVITPWHISANRIAETVRGSCRYGSCGLGIGETMEDVRELGEEVLRVGDLTNRRVLRRKLLQVRDRKLVKIGCLKITAVSKDKLASDLGVLQNIKNIDWYLERCEDFARRVCVVNGGYLRSLLDEGPTVFEGAQGMLLDVRYGFAPHITKTDITYHNALKLLREAGYAGKVTKLGVLRGYSTRHGNGPFVTEDRSLTEDLPDAFNKSHPWQGNFRAGHFDLVAGRYALEAIGGVDQLAVTNLDRLHGRTSTKICLAYQLDGKSIERISIRRDEPSERVAQTEELRRAKPVYEEVPPAFYFNRLSLLLGICPTIWSCGPTAEDKRSHSKP